MANTLTRDEILDALAAFAAQRPGLDPGNYDRAGYTADSRQITRDLNDARALLAQVRWRRNIDAEQLRSAFRAFSGRLTLREDGTLDYCTGQYWPTEYRKAVCAVLASALWTWWREDCGCKTGDDIRATARRELGRSLASRWFT